MQAPVHKLIIKEQQASEREDPKIAAQQYEAILKKRPFDMHANTRLMILYRKQKEYKKEVALIKKAIAYYEKIYKDQQPSHSAKVTALSRSLAFSTGLTTKKGKALYDPEPVRSWKKRLITAEKSLKIRGKTVQ